MKYKQYYIAIDRGDGYRATGSGEISFGGLNPFKDKNFVVSEYNSLGIPEWGDKNLMKVTDTRSGETYLLEKPSSPKGTEEAR